MRDKREVQPFELGHGGSRSATKSGGRRSTTAVFPPPFDGALFSAFERPGPALPLISRDAYVVETSAKLDVLQRELAAAKVELADMKRKLDFVTEETEQKRRFEHFLESEQRTRAEATDETRRIARELKSRLDRIEAKTGGNYHGYATFEAISKRLTELGDERSAWQRAARDLKINAALLCSGVMAWAVLIVRYGV